jgi:hypothetical protein
LAEHCMDYISWIPEPSTVNNKLKRREGSGIQGMYYRVSKKPPQNHWNSVLLKFECPSTKLNTKMRKILTRVHILNIDLLRN